MTEWTLVGAIALLQVQRGVMTGRGRYDLAPLVEVDRLRLTPDGAFGLLEGAWIVDRHHRHHSDARHWHDGETVSFGFTSHYEHMWQLFRETPLGRAGENIIVGAPEMLAIDHLAGGLRIESAEGIIEFRSPEVLEPCVEFTRFMTGDHDGDARALKPQREMLRNGVRGFVVGFGGPDPVEISPGDEVSVRAR